MSCWFFFSYAHADHDNFLKQFYEDLLKEVRGLVGATAEAAGFVDRKDIEHVATWDVVLQNALQSCRVFVPIYSPSYFLSEYCGKEFKVFRDRARAAIGDDSLILPVLLNHESNVAPKIPEAINKIQYTIQDYYPPEYTSEGLLQLIRLGVAPNAKYYNQYWEFVRKLATKIVAAANTHVLPDSPSLTPLDQVSSLFPAATRVVAAGSAGEGPRYVQFIFVVGKDNELAAGQRCDLKFYGPQGAADWKPYLDAYPDSAAALAIQAVSETAKDLNYEEIPLGPGVVNQIQEASNKNRIVVILLDTWTLRLETYQRLIEPLDNYSSVGCLMIVLWNESDPEAATHKSTLDTAVEAMFSNKIGEKNPNFLRSIPYSSFKTQLIGALTRTQAAIVQASEMRQRLKYASVKTAQTGQFATKPSL